MKSLHAAGLLVFTAISLTACPAPVVPVAAPSMQISAKVIKNTSNEDCLTFAGVPSDDLIIYKVIIRDPIARSETFIPAGSGQTVARTNPINLQDDGICYDKRSGSYSFEFTASRIGGGAVTVNSFYAQQ